VAARTLAMAANNPTAPIDIFQLRNVLVPVVPEASGPANSFQLEPVLALLASHFVPFDQLLKLTVPFPSAPSPNGAAGLGDIQLFDLISIKQSWGRWGFGPALVFPTATAPALGQGKWQAGPAVGLIYAGIKHLVLGAILQNPISFAGSGSRPNVNALTITPSVTYNFEGGWFGGMSDFDLTFDWENNGAATIPLGGQFGRVFTILKQPFSFSLEGAYNVAIPSSAAPRWEIGIELSWIFIRRSTQP
jgi:hypothetical protein